MYHIICRLHHYQVRVYLVSRDTITHVIGNNQSVAQFDEHSFEREAVTRSLRIAAYRIMADENKTFRLAALWQHDFSGKGNLFSITIEARVGADNLYHFVLVAVLEQFLYNSRTGYAACLARTVIRTGGLV